jgi:hypothetical protein
VRGLAWPLAIALGGLLLLLLSVPGLPTAFRAATGGGEPGVFTATRLECVRHPGHEACSWQGTFTSPAGPPRAVYLYGSDRDTLREGDRIPVTDVGRPDTVYGPGGSTEWIWLVSMLVTGCGLLTASTSRLLTRRRPTAIRPAA